MGLVDIAYDILKISVLKSYKGKLNIDVLRGWTINYFYAPDNNSGDSVHEILLRISNSGNKDLGISKINVKHLEKEPIIFDLYEYKGLALRRKPKLKSIDSILLKPEETKIISLRAIGNLFEKDKYDVTVEFYNSKCKIMKVISLTLNKAAILYHCDRGQVYLAD